MWCKFIQVLACLKHLSVCDNTDNTTWHACNHEQTCLQHTSGRDNEQNTTWLTFVQEQIFLETLVWSWQHGKHNRRDTHSYRNWPAWKHLSPREPRKHNVTPILTGTRFLETLLWSWQQGKHVTNIPGTSLLVKYSYIRDNTENTTWTLQLFSQNYIATC